MTRPLPPELVSVLEEGRQLYVAVDARRGPHVTPELYAWSGGMLWFAAASTTLKSKVLPRRPLAGALVDVPGRTALLTGEVTRLSPWRPLEVAAQLPHLAAAPKALARYTTRNAADLGAFWRDTVTGRLGWRPPPPRELFCLRPTRVALAENGHVVHRWNWDGRPPKGAADERLPSGGRRAVAAFPHGVALPGDWFADEHVLRVPREVLALADLPRRFAMSLVTDEYRAPGPAAKRGVLVRGEGRLDRDQPGVVHVEPERVVRWLGTDTSSVAAGARSR